MLIAKSEGFPVSIEYLREQVSSSAFMQNCNFESIDGVVDIQETLCLSGERRDLQNSQTDHQAEQMPRELESIQAQKAAED